MYTPTPVGKKIYPYNKNGTDIINVENTQERNAAAKAFIAGVAASGGTPLLVQNCAATIERVARPGNATLLS